MKKQMTDPQVSMISFQECILDSRFEIAPVSQHENLYSYADMPEPGERRLTYVRLDEDKKTVKAFLSCVLNGQVGGHLCVSVGYAVPEQYRNLGYAKSILRDVVQDLCIQAQRNGLRGLAVEAVIDQFNLASRKVAEAVLEVQAEPIIESLSKKPALRYTAKFNITD